MSSEEKISFRRFFAEALAPKDGFGRALLALVILRNPIVWLASWLGRREPIEVTALYRPGGDIQYYELLHGLAHGNVGETNLHEMAGSGLHSFPYGGMWLHVLLFRPFGAWGILLADTIVTAIGYAAYYMIARASKLSIRGAMAFAAFVTAYLYVVLTPLTNRLGWMPDLLWGDRFPRPFLTEIYAVIAYATLIRLWRTRPVGPAGEPDDSDPAARSTDVRSLGLWVFSGLVFSLLVQSDVYTAFIVGLGYAGLFGERLVRWPALRRETLKAGIVMAVVLAATAWPFALQQRATAPWLLVRWGVYPIPRLTGLLWAKYTPIGGPLFVAIGALAAWGALRRYSRTVEESAPRSDTRIVRFWILLAAIAVLAFPLFFVITGKGLYPYQSVDRLRRVAMLSTVLLIATAGRVAIGGLSFGSLATASAPSPAFARIGEAWRGRRALRWAVAIGLLGVVAAAFVARAVTNLRREDHVRTWYKLGPGVSYRAAFADLTRELNSPKYEGKLVLGTLDQQVHVYWQAFKGGRSFVPDGWISVAPNDEMERRFILFAQAIGASADEYLAMAQVPGHSGLIFDATYSANREYAIAPLSDYTEDQVRRIRARDLYTSFAFELPISEIARMRARYLAANDGPMPRLDVIVLNNDAEVGHLAPPSAELELTFQNAMFRVFLRRSPAPSP